MLPSVIAVQIGIPYQGFSDGSFKRSNKMKDLEVPNASYMESIIIFVTNWLYLNVCAPNTYGLGLKHSLLSNKEKRYGRIVGLPVPSTDTINVALY